MSFMALLNTFRYLSVGSHCRAEQEGGLPSDEQLLQSLTQQRTLGGVRGQPTSRRLDKGASGHATTVEAVPPPVDAQQDSWAVRSSGLATGVFEAEGESCSWGVLSQPGKHSCTPIAGMRVLTGGRAYGPANRHHKGKWQLFCPSCSQRDHTSAGELDCKGMGAYWHVGSGKEHRVGLEEALSFSACL